MSINNIVNTFENANKLQEPKSFFHGHKVINDPIHVNTEKTQQIVNHLYKQKHRGIYF